MLVNEISNDSSPKIDLNQILEKAKIPTLPVVAQKLVELCKDDRAAFADFARLIESDPGLASRILRVANSAYYGLRNKATNLERAITALGLKQVKTVALGFHLAASLNEFKAEGFDIGDFWQKSVFRAVLGRKLAKKYCPNYSEEAFLVGLLQDCGILLLAQALGADYIHMWADKRCSLDSLFRLEQKVFEVNHLQVAARIAQKWGLPEILSRPLSCHHHKPESQTATDPMIQMCQIAYFIGTFSLHNPESVSENDVSLPEFCENVFGISQRDMKLLLVESKEEFLSISKLFSGILPEHVNAANLLSQANTLLSRLASYEPQELFDLEEEVRLLRQRCENLASSLDEYKQLATTDDLTGLSKRKSLEVYLDTACRSVATGVTSLSVLFIDVDNFSNINNTYGHAAGDCFLTGIADLLKSLFNINGCICRYGGDEFVVALMGMQAKQAIQLSVGLNRKIRDLEIPKKFGRQAGEGKFSCSIGLLHCEQGSQVGGGHRVLELADHQMYEAKRQGKDGLRFQLIKKDSE
jgi:two-component system, cell cycle response regulator